MEKYELNVVGVSFGDRQKYLQLIDKKIKCGYELTDIKAELVRDPNNPKDSNAIKVVLDGYHVGFLERELVKDVAPSIDAGLKLGCELSYLGKKDEDSYYGIKIKVWQIT